MDALEEESFALSFSSASDAEFDAVVGYLEDIIMEKYIEEQLLERIPGFNMAAFTTTLEKEGRGLDLSSGLVVTSLCKSSSVPASPNNLRH
uniref:ADP-ribosylation factor-like protein 2-binding protein n=1 Tax=Cebus imitator TaxID=2715852 RepID=A0A2K5QIP6_CEBIM